MILHVLLVTFSLRNTSKDYTQFFVTVRGYSQNWWHFIEQTVIVAAYYDATTFSGLLVPHIDTNDSLLVAEIDARTCQGWLPLPAWEWLKNMSNEASKQKLVAALVPPPALRP